MHKIIPVFIPHEGCPHDCSFCNQKKIAGVAVPPDEDAILEMVRRYRDTNRKKDVSFTLAYYGGSFTAIEPERQVRLLSLAKMLVEKQMIQGIRISTRPDYLSDIHVERLSEYGVGYVEIGVQSTDPEVLRLANRSYDLDVVKKAVDRLKKAGIGYGVQMMVGLPGDDEKKLYRTTVDLVELEPKSVRIYPCLVLADTLLEEWYRKGSYKPLEIREAVELSTIPYVFFSNRKIPIIRMGLHSSDSLQDEKSLIAGPFHPSFGELVISNVYKNMLESFIEDVDIRQGMVYVGADKRIHSKIVGNKSFVFREILERKGVSLQLKTAADMGKDVEVTWNGNTRRLNLAEYRKRLEHHYSCKYDTRM